MDAVVNMVSTTFLLSILLLIMARGHAIQTSCLPSRLKAIILNDMPHVRELQNKYELEGNKPKCQEMFPLKNFPSCNLRGTERLAVSIYKISLTIEVLENMTMDPLVRKNLETFTVIQNELSKCPATKSLAGESCQQHLMRYSKKIPTECLQNNVLFHLIQTLCEDVGLLLPGEHLRDEVHKESLPVTPKFRSSKKQKRRRKNRRRKTRKSWQSQPAKQHPTTPVPQALKMNQEAVILKSHYDKLNDLLMDTFISYWTFA